MSPRPNTLLTQALDGAETLTGEEIVVSGISGRFPESDSVRHFMENLYNKVDMVTDDNRRWNLDHPDIPNAVGKLTALNVFDAQFFGVHYRQAWCMDPMVRMLLEEAYGAILDAGINPRDLRGSNTGVYVSVSTSDAEKTWFYKKDQISGLGLTGTACTMLSNRISYWLGTHGPSYTLAAECAGTAVCLEHAYNAIRSGLCDTVIVGGANICVNPKVSLQMSNLGILSDDGKTRCFDKNANGYGRAEAVNVMILQKAKSAKRAYAQVVHAKTNCAGYNEMHTKHIDRKAQREFLQEFYREANVSPTQVQYVEAFGAGIPEVDKNELDAIDDVFCKDRKHPILVGSVKSNMGHAEAVSGLCAATKVCLAYHKGTIAPNLHYCTARDDVAGVREGRIRVVTEPAPLTGYAALNSFGLTGVNVHVLFKRLPNMHKEKMPDDLPRLVVLAMRSEEKIIRSFADLASRPLDLQQLALLHNFHTQDIPGQVFRSYAIFKMSSADTEMVTRHAEYFPGLKRPVWFVYSGMGSQWSGMGKQLLRIPVFAAAIQRCIRVLVPKGVDLMRILTDPDPSVYDNILHSFVGIAAVQIGLTDVLRELGVRPDNIIGHSVGELGCAYADGCLSAEEMILAAYSRGLVSVQTTFIKGSMAAVGIGYNQIKSTCPPSIEVACHNGPDSCTISGPAEEMKAFVGQLTEKGIFAKEVPCSNIAYHSKYIAQAGPNLLKMLQEVIKYPKPRSERWLSTSIPQNRWDEPLAKTCSAAYQTNNLLSPVLFEETSRLIPSNAITIEVAPHGLLQTILRRSLGKDCINIALTKRHHSDNVEMLLDAAGKLFVAGVNVQIGNIYPATQFPVPASTSLTSHMVGWEHSEKWLSHTYLKDKKIYSGERHFLVTTSDEEHKFLSGCVINGVNVFPAAGYLVLVWETLGMMLGEHYTHLPVVFEDVHFESDAVLSDTHLLELVIMIHKANGRFEVTSECGILVKGTITKNAIKMLQKEKHTEDNKEFLTSDDVYSIMSSKGYTYMDEFRSIDSASVCGTKGRIRFTDNWVTFLDGVLQMHALGRLTRTVSKPTLIRRLRIDVDEHLRCFADAIDITVDSLYERTRCGGIELEGLVVEERPVTEIDDYIVEECIFMPYFSADPMQITDALGSILQTVAQNVTSATLSIVVVDDDDSKILSKEIENLLKERGTKYEVTLSKNSFRTSNLLVVSDLNSNENILKETSSDCFVLTYDRKTLHQDFSPSWTVVSRLAVASSSDVCLLLAKPSRKGIVKSSTESASKLSLDGAGNTKFITVKWSENFHWLQLVKSEWRACTRLILVSEGEPCAGLLGMVDCLRREPGGHVLSLLLIADPAAPAFRSDLPLYRNQLDKQLAFNVYRNGEWGSYQYVSLASQVLLQSEHAYLASRQPENINSLAWLQGPRITRDKPLGDSVKRVQVYYSAVSDTDAKVATGRRRFHEIGCNEPWSAYGSDFSGRTSTGERVMGVINTGALSSEIDADADLMWPVPPHWSLEDASTVPLAYAVAYYCLQMKANLEPGMSVLIHDGGSALGRAAINICLARSCRVFATVGSLREKRLLLRTIPQLIEKYIGNMRNESFEEIVMTATKGIGCHIVLNTLTGDLIKISSRCVAHYGKLLHINEESPTPNETFGMSVLYINKEFKPVQISDLFLLNRRKDKRMMQRLVANGIASGEVRPLTRVVLDASDACRAFRLASRRVTSGLVANVLVRLRQEELLPFVTPSRALLPARPAFSCRRDAVYVVVSQAGCDRTALQLADWLVRRGATALMLHCSATPYRAFYVRRWSQLGVKLNTFTKTLHTEAACSELLSDAATLGPVVGLFIAPSSIVRIDFENIKTEQISKSYDEMALVVNRLDSVSRKTCPLLEHFVVVSFAAAGRGRRGAVAHAATESALQRLCEQRVKLELPALAFQLDHVPNDDLSAHQYSKSPNNNSILGRYLDYLDDIIESKKPVACVLRVRREKQSAMLNSIGSVLGVANFDQMPEHTPLEQLLDNEFVTKEIQALLERRFQAFFTAEKIAKTTIAEWRKLVAQLRETVVSRTGLGMFFDYVDTEEYNVDDSLIRMPTLLSDSYKTGEEKFSRGTYLCLLPGLEGHSNVFLKMAQRLKMNAFTCQYELNVDDSVTDMAAKISQIVIKKLRPEENFLLLGYSFGAMVALELAVKLEEAGLTGQVFCLDGSPAWLAALLSTHLGHMSERQLQDELVVHMYRIMGDDDTDENELRQTLAIESTWEGKLDTCLLLLRGRVTYTLQYMRQIIDTAYARIRQARAYSDERLRSRPLRSTVVLLSATRRPPELEAAARALGPDLGLGAYCTSPVTVHELDTDHAAAPHHLRVADILNKHLVDPEHFNSLNLCDIYAFQDATSN